MTRKPETKKKKCNIAETLKEAAKAFPEKTALASPAGNGPDGKTVYREIAFGELDELSDRLASGLSQTGVKRGTRTLVMVKHGIEFVAVTFALFKCGAVPVFIDPGMGKKNLLNCARQVNAEAFVGIPLAHIFRIANRKHFSSVKHLVTVGWKLWGGRTFDEIRRIGSAPFKIENTLNEDTAAIIFTTGSTGPPKGVTYTHGVFTAQVNLIRNYYGLTPRDVDLAVFPLFALFSIGMGIKTIIPDMNPSKPAKADPAKIVKAIEENGVTYSFGSPALWRNAARYCVEKKIRLPLLRKVLMAGAPVSAEIHGMLLNEVMDKNGQTHTPYGATESMPISDMTGSEALEETARLTAKGKGICVGRPLPGIKIQVIPITKSAVGEWDEVLALPADDIGEIAVKGPVVTKEYYGLPEQTLKSKIKEGENVWHRMGDVGYFDKNGRLWFCGRKGHMVITKDDTLYTVCCEAIFNNHPDVFRSALVGLGSLPNQRPVIIIELTKEGKKRRQGALKTEILKLGAKSDLTMRIKDVLFHAKFPTDIRHNAKIFRERLKEWAESKLPHLIPKSESKK